MNKGIKTRILSYYLIAITITVSIIGIFAWYSVKQYYYRSIQFNMEKEMYVANTFLNKYLSNANLREASESMMDNLFLNTDIQVEVINENKKLVLDSLSIKELDFSNDIYVDNAIREGRESTVYGKLLPYSDDNVMIVTQPIKNRTVKGALRFTTSLEKVDSTLMVFAMFIALVAIFIIIIIFLVSMWISKGIIGPLIKVNNAASMMAKGEYTVKAEKVYDDEVGNLADTLNMMSEEILKNDKLKNEFISSISHELKTPLTSIKGWGMTLKIKELQSEEMMDKGLDIIISESDRLTELVNDLLDFSKYESGNISLKIEDVDINQMLKDICLQISPRCKRSGIGLSYIDNDLGIIKADRNRMKQVFINILDNSIKFSPKGFIKIYSEKNDDFISIIIEDNGCGIKKKDINRVRQKFFKSSLESPGNGIGLALCDEIVKLHNGTMDIESVYGKGTKVIVKLKH